jgi:hypothetical protein
MKWQNCIVSKNIDAVWLAWKGEGRNVTVLVRSRNSL